MYMLRYLKLFIQFIRSNVIREIEYRGNFVISVFVTFLWVVFQVLIAKFYFHFTANIAGWNEAQVFFLIGTTRLVRGLFNLFAYINLIYLPDEVNRGNFDLTLLRPVNTLFITSLAKQM